MSLYDCGHSKDEAHPEECEICSPTFFDNKIDSYVLTRLNQLELKVDAMPEILTGMVKELLYEIDQEKSEARKEKVIKVMDYLKKSGLLAIGGATLEMIRFIFSLF